jgi:hypothetical protein
MATPISTQDKVLVTVASTLCGQRVLNTFRYRVSAATPGTGQDVALTALVAQLRLSGGWITRLKNAYPENLTVDAIWAQVYAPIRYRKYVTIINDNGNYAAEAATANQAAVITRFSEVARRDGISNMHVPVAGTPDVMQGGFLTNTFKTLLGLAGLAMTLNIITPAPAVTFIPVVNDTGLPFAGDVAGYEIGDTARIMRRRTVGLGI